MLNTDVGDTVQIMSKNHSSDIVVPAILEFPGVSIPEKSDKIHSQVLKMMRRIRECPKMMSVRKMKHEIEF